jgi:ribosomal protein S18 acetylase RimI-like enzyme
LGARSTSDPVIRPLRAEEAPAARALVLGVVGDTPYRFQPLSALDAALGAESDEARALVAAEGEELVGLALYGRVAGTLGAGKLHLAVVTAGARLRGVGRRLADAAAADLAARGCRFVLAETPGDAMLAPGLELLARAGFAEEARVRDYYRDGIPLLLLRRDLSSPQPAVRSPQR